MLVAQDKLLLGLGGTCRVTLLLSLPISSLSPFPSTTPPLLPAKCKTRVRKLEKKVVGNGRGVAFAIGCWGRLLMGGNNRMTPLSISPSPFLHESLNSQVSRCLCGGGNRWCRDRSSIFLNLGRFSRIRSQVSSRNKRISVYSEGGREGGSGD